MTEKKKDIILIGGGGHCKSCIDVIEQEGKYRIYGILDRAELIGGQVLGYEIIGEDENAKAFVNAGFSFLVTVGQIRSAELRKTLFDKLRNMGAELATIISPLAYVSQYAEIGEGTIVLHRATVNAGARIGKNTILNTGCNIDHDTIIGNHCHVSTHAVVNGNCVLGDEVFLGSNTTISSQVRLGSNIIVGAGSLVISDTIQPGVWAGSPIKKI